MLFDQQITTDNARSVSGSGPPSVAPGSWAAWFSLDGGAHWSRARHPGSVWTLPSNDPALGAIACATARRCWALVTSRDGAPTATAILATSDSGARWTVRPLPASLAGRFLPGAISCAAPRLCWLGGSRTGGNVKLGPELLGTADGGASWSVTRLPAPSGSVTTTGVVPQIGLISCPAANRCVAIPFTNPNARRVPVYSLGAP